MAKRSILSDEELAKGAQAIADDIRVGETRRVKLARIIEEHLDWFERARERGLEWTDLVDLLFKAGVTRPDGRPLSRGHLSSLVWRKQKSAVAPRAVALAPRPAAKQQPNSPPETVQGKAAPVAKQQRSSLDLPKPSHPALPPAARDRTEPPTDESPDRASVVAFMRRAARLRRNE